MRTAQSAVQRVYGNIQSLDECFREYFAMEDHVLKNYRGQWEEQLFAQLALGLKSRCVCAKVRDERFLELREAVMAFQELPEIKNQVNQTTPKP